MQQQNLEAEIQLQPFHNEQLLRLDDIQNKSMPNILRLLKYKHQIQTVKNKQTQHSPFYISPLSRFTLYYNVTYFLFFYLIQAHVSLTMAFGPNFLSNQLSIQAFTIYYWFLFSFFIFDILLTFNKGYYDSRKAIIVNDLNSIIKRYLKFQFWIDIICIGILIIPQIETQANHEFIELIPLILLWVKKFKHQNQIIRIIQYHKKKRIFFVLFILTCDILILGHFGACIFIKMSFLLKQSQYYGPDNKYYWLTTNDPYDFTQFQGHWYYIYAYAQSMSTGTLSTIAPGPYPKNPISVIYSIGLTLFFMILTSYVAQILIEILQTEQQKRLNYEQKIQKFNKFMLLKKVSTKLKVKINNYLQVLWSIQQEQRKKQQSKVINMLPLTMKQEILIQLSFLKYFQPLQTLKNNKKLLYQLNLIIKREIISPQSQIFQNIDLIINQPHQRAKVNNKMRFLASGTLSFDFPLNSEYNSVNKNPLQNSQLRQRQNIICLSNVDRFIGLFQFLTKQPCFLKCKTIDLCQIDTISRKQFQQLVKKTGNFQKFNKLKNQILIERKFKLIKRVCYVCFDDTHIETTCPEIYFSTKLKINMMERQNNIGRSQLRRIHFDKNKIKNHKSLNNNIKSPKIYYRQNYFLKNHKNNFQKMICVVNEIQRGLKTKRTINQQKRSDKFQKIAIWQDFYPEFNFIKNKMNKTYK